MAIHEKALQAIKRGKEKRVVEVGGHFICFQDRESGTGVTKEAGIRYLVLGSHPAHQTIKDQDSIERP